MSQNVWRHVVMFSGGVGSWATAKRVALAHGTDNLTLLFADTLKEGDDLYRFLHEAAENVGVPVTVVRDGRTPFEVYHDDRFLGNARLANCSKYLKQKPCREWLKAHCFPSKTMLYVGIDWSEIHRTHAIREGWKPYRVEFPMCERPYLSKQQMLDWLEREGVAPPEAYAQGMPHNNCMAQGCVRGGQAYWATFLRTNREAYLQTEQDEQELREYLDADVTILRDRTGGASTPITLKAFRERLEQQGSLFDHMDYGPACGCFVDAGDEGELGLAA